MTKSSYAPIVEMRDRFMQAKNPEAAEICNEMMAILDDSPSLFILSKTEANELTKYFLQCGYINREFHESVHAIIDRLMEFSKRTR